MYWIGTLKFYKKPIRDVYSYMNKDINNKVGIVGTGFVGQSLKEAFEEWGVEGINTYDIAKESSCSSLEELVEKSEYIFVCVPTPTEKNKPNFKIVFDTCLEINLIAREKVLVRTVLIKSTTLPYVVREISDSCKDVRLVTNPEFLTQKTALEDTLNPTRVVYGCDDKDYASEMSMIFSHQFLKDKTKYFITGLEEAMKIKYASNVFGAYKIMFFNIIHEWCDTHEEFDIIRNGVCSSGWVADMHSIVPYNGSFGFGGACLPKDLIAMAEEMAVKGFEEESKYLMACSELNKKVKDKRKDIKL